MAEEPRFASYARLDPLAGSIAIAADLFISRRRGRSLNSEAVAVAFRRMRAYCDWIGLKNHRPACWGELWGRNCLAWQMFADLVWNLEEEECPPEWRKPMAEGASEKCS